MKYTLLCALPQCVAATACFGRLGDRPGPKMRQQTCSLSAVVVPAKQLVAINGRYSESLCDVEGLSSDSVRFICQPRENVYCFAMELLIISVSGCSLSWLQ